MILNSDYDSAGAVSAVANGNADAIAFGRPFIANPDLPRRIADGMPLAKDVAQTWYSQGPVGYVDYPAAA
jgi:2,4-dienoyl-CoA reductase-like NADH-dependent reductase (Old Yellow Enzyme family)